MNNQQLDLNTIMYYMIMIMMIGMVMKVMTRELKPVVERPLIYGPRGEILTRRSGSSHSSSPNPKPARRTTVWCPVCKQDVEVGEHNRITRTEALRKHLEEKHGRQHFSAKYPEHVKTASSVTDFIAEASINMWEVDADVDRASANMEPIPGKTFSILEHTNRKVREIAYATRGMPYAKDIQDEYMPRVTTLLSRIEFAAKKVDGFIAGRNEDEASNWAGAVEDCTQELAKLQNHAIIDTYERLSGEEVSSSHSIHGEPRRRLVDKYGSWAVGRAEAVCPEGDVACVEREAGKLIYAYRRSFTG